MSPNALFINSRVSCPGCRTDALRLFIPQQSSVQRGGRPSVGDSVTARVFYVCRVISNDMLTRTVDNATLFYVCRVISNDMLTRTVDNATLFYVCRVISNDMLTRTVDNPTLFYVCLMICLLNC
ncbi:hypothetical protein RRG08_011950 [Elysia crispata]|uniref:Uncharacterized protein n=1 Tax=Elysia crispata TaxID=231223 RepID=A0AAE0ZJP6_9GAST|nr:hypothetical protein RRG08_011950 [Elysia crispata]